MLPCRPEVLGLWPLFLAISEPCRHVDESASADERILRRRHDRAEQTNLTTIQNRNARRTRIEQVADAGSDVEHTVTNFLSNAHRSADRQQDCRC